MHTLARCHAILRGMGLGFLACVGRSDGQLSCAAGAKCAYVWGNEIFRYSFIGSVIASVCPTSPVVCCICFNVCGD